MPHSPTTPKTTPTSHYDFFATCPRNTESLVLQELRALGAADATETRSGVNFSGPLSLGYRACLWSRVASRVLLRLASFPVSTPDDLYESIRSIPWEDHLDVAGTLAVETTSKIKQGPLANLNTHYAEQRVKDAVVDRFRARTGKRPGVDRSRPCVRINLHLAPDGAIVGLDLSGDGLHRRGYRLEGGEAPLKENLAAAILMRAGWPRLAAAGSPLVDPMCGSGTLLVEGALMAADVAPGLLRDYYGFLGWKGFDPIIWDTLLSEARERREQGMKRLPPIIGFDLDQKAVGTARGNIRRAGLAGHIVSLQQKLADLQNPIPANQPGLVVTNPPYGKRLGDIEDLVEVYETLGHRLKQSFGGWGAAIFTGNPELGAYLGLRAHRVNVFYNGPLECKLLHFHIDGHTAARPDRDTRPAGNRETEPETSGGFMFGNRLRKNFRHLRRWALREDIHCYRLYDADLPEYAVAIDLYEDWAHVQEYAPPSSIDPVRARRRLREIIVLVPEILEIPPDHVMLKVRRPQRGTGQYQRLRDEGQFVQVREGGLNFLVNLTDYLDTGLFLDHRLMRGRIRELASGRRFLNLFAYTGSATVYAASGGAMSTTTIDLSTTHLDWAQRNLRLNGFSGPEHKFIRADCLEWLARSAAVVDPSSAYDLIFLDAPAFSNSKKMAGILDIQRDHVRLIQTASHLLSPEGILIFSTNLQRFRLDAELGQQFSVIDITRQTIPPDFARNPRIHACFQITATAGSQSPRVPRNPEES